MSWSGNGPCPNARFAPFTKRKKTPDPAPLVAADIAGLVTQLGATKFKHRQKAHQRLIKLGREALPLLDEYLKTDDAEIILRIKRIKETIKTRTRNKHASASSPCPRSDALRGNETRTITQQDITMTNKVKNILSLLPLLLAANAAAVESEAS